MSLLQSTYNLLFDSKRFFEETKIEKIGKPLLITIIYAVVSSLVTIPTLLMASSAVPAVGGIDLGGVIIVSGVISTIFTVIISWILVALIFFALLKIIGYATCKYGQVLSVCGYVSAILMIESILMGLIALIGNVPSVVTLILNGVFLLWSIPVWYFGFASISPETPEKKLKLAIAIPVIIMVLFTIISSAGTMLVF